MNAILPKFSQLPENKQKVVKMRAEGTTLEAISAETSVPLRTVAEWVTPAGTCVEELEEFKSYLADKAIKSTDVLLERAKIDAERVWDKLVALAMSDDPNIPQHVVLGAVDSVLDRAGIARVSKTEGKFGVSISDEDRRKRFERLRELQSDVEPIALKQIAGGKE